MCDPRDRARARRRTRGDVGRDVLAVRAHVAGLDAAALDSEESDRGDAGHAPPEAHGPCIGHDRDHREREHDHLVREEERAAEAGVAHAGAAGHRGRQDAAVEKAVEHVLKEAKKK